MPKVVINKCYGGFGLSKEAWAEVLRRILAEPEPVESKYGGPIDASSYDGEVPRDNPHLVAVVEEMGAAANDRYAELKVVDVPDGVDWGIQEYDGSEWIAERHRTWG